MNILLLGMPGSGKTKVGKLLAKELQREFVDIDEFIFEKTGKDSAEHLKELGDAEFLKFEAGLVKKIKTVDAVIAASGSVPLVAEGIEHLKKNAFVIWLKPSLKIIKERIGKRSDGISRIVGAQTKTLAEIWEWRKKAYQFHHHAILDIETEIPTEEVVEQVLKILKENAIV
ncbi:AAA family ATPase [Candidatus Gracilibacteria bacterium]|nr:AAA family ATPase [Candidatus Gracilibacteria bacterium]